MSGVCVSVDVSRGQDGEVTVYFNGEEGVMLPDGIVSTTLWVTIDTISGKILEIRR